MIKILLTVNLIMKMKLGEFFSVICLKEPMMKKFAITSISREKSPVAVTAVLPGISFARLWALGIYALLALVMIITINSTSSGSQAGNQDLYTLKGTLKLVDGGKIERKVRVPSFETTDGPVGSVRTLDGGAARGRNLFQGTGEVGNLKQIYMRETTAYTEIQPAVFLRQRQEGGGTRPAISVKESFEFESLPPGEYEMTISVPGHTPVVLDLTLDPADARDGEFRFSRSFEPSDPQESRLLKNHYAPRDVSEGAKSEYNKGVEAINKAQLDQALVFFTRAVSRADHFTEAYERIGMIHLSRDDIAEAEANFRKALEIDLYSYRSLSNLGTILLNQGEVEEALKYYRLAVKVAPHIAQARYHLAMALFQVGELEEAASQLEKQKALDRDHYTQPQLLFAEIEGRNQNNELMVQEREEFLETVPADPKCDQVKQALTVAREIQEENDKN